MQKCWTASRKGRHKGWPQGRPPGLLGSLVAPDKKVIQKLRQKLNKKFVLF
jgi:hypothetical protein